jgi:hypothetical protein
VDINDPMTIESRTSLEKMLSLLILLVLVSGYSACPITCNCTQNLSHTLTRNKLHCHDSDVPAVINEVASWEKHPYKLVFDSCRPVGMLEKLPPLTTTELTLVRCGINSITKNAFDDLPNLQRLVLFENNISALNWRVPSEVNRLDLRSNRIPNIPRRAFINNNNLRILSLQNNTISYISSTAFDRANSRLYEIGLSGNNLTHFPARFFKKNSVSPV